MTQTDKQIEKSAGDILTITGADMVIIATVEPDQQPQAVVITNENGLDVRNISWETALRDGIDKASEYNLEREFFAAAKWFLNWRLARKFSAHKMIACDRQIDLLGQLLEQLEKDGSTGIVRDSIFHKAIEEAVKQGRDMWRVQ